ncbi:DUF6934 family protein [Dyadobacter endophyticus]|uniref:Uncharacterized protein n=1 Tax=Dyadobacter endophyticus TaxID=1749036 RepID=A0ABQ1YKY8_9BACT|nr:hypothetical protein [Dyadobacter endophyticus]GGH30087.1 hypothetical protein GCM10007423_17990 [Dyadobacter endophyticus]
MHLPKYRCTGNESKSLFEFFSEGPHGRIRKLVEFTRTKFANVYNLGFGDFDESSKCINDIVITNNGDSMKVLTTVASTVYDFTAAYPKAIIFATGSTKSRTRLYRIGINRHLIEIQRDFVIFGSNNYLIWEEFVPGNEYNAFFLTKKENQQALWRQLAKVNRQNHPQ